MKVKKIISAALAIAAAASVFSGCTGKKKSSGGKVTLKYVMCAPGKQEDSDMVWTEWNKKLQEKLPNVEVQFELIPLSEYKQKFALMCASHEEMDIANNYGLDFSTEVHNGTFIPMDELIEKYGQEMKSVLPDWFFDYQKIDGSVYGIPTYQMCANLRGMCFIKEYADKYLDLEGFTKEMQSNEFFTEKAFSYLEEAMEKAAADGIKFKSALLPNFKGGERLISTFYTDENERVENIRISDNTVNAYYKTARRWFEKKYIRQDVVGATDQNNYIGKKDGYMWWDAVWTPFNAENLSKKYGMEIITVPYTSGYEISKDASAGGTSIMASSKHPEEAMQVINLLNSDKELYNMLVYGIEGKHYKKVGEDRIETVAPTGQATANDKYGLYKWIVGNTQLAYDNQLEPEGYKKWVFEEVNGTNDISKLIGFVVDTSKISNEITQVDAVNDEFYNSLISGAYPNWEEMLREYKEKLELAGNSKITEELQKQVNEFLAGKK